MRKLIVSVNMTLDGFMAGPHCELDWHFSHWNDEMARYQAQQLERADTILLGRVTYMAMARYWPAVAMSCTHSREDLAFAGMMNHYRKVVCSKTIEETPWANTTVIRRGFKTAIGRLKQEPGKDILVYGSGVLIASLRDQHLVDEYVVWVHPVVLGAGKPLFREPKSLERLTLKHTRFFNSGVVALAYAKCDYG